MLKSGDPQRRHRGAGEVVAPLARQASARCAPASANRPQQVDRALVEPEVVDRAGDLAVLDQVDAVAGQPGEQQRLRVDLADVPQAGQQQPALGAGDQVVERRRSRRRPRGPGCRSPGVTGSPVSSARVPGLAAAPRSSPSRDPVGRGRAAGRCRRPTVASPDARATTNGAHSRPGVRRVAEQRQRPVGRAARRPGCRRRGLAEDRTGPRARRGRRPSSRRRSSGRRPRSAAGSCRSGRPAGRRAARAQPSRRASSASSAGASTSAKSRVAPPDPGASAPGRSACRCSSKWPVGCTCRSRSPVEMPRYVVVTSWSTNP